MPRMLHCKLLRAATVAHAKIVSIDTSEAEAMPTASSPSSPAKCMQNDVRHPSGQSQDEHALCFDKVRFVGDPIAAVAALDRGRGVRGDEARSRSSTSRSTPVYEPASRRSPTTGADLIHEYGDDGNVHKRVSMEFGDVAKALEDADEVLDDIVFFQGNTHLPMEQHATLAWYPEADGRLTVWSSTQTPHYLHKADGEGARDASRRRICASWRRPNGGGFGGKSDPFNHEIAVAKLALITQPPGARSR